CRAGGYCGGTAEEMMQNDPVLKVSETLKAKVAEYSKVYRHPKRPKFVVHPLYKIEHGHKGCWEGTPASYQPGCYAVFGQDGEFLYLGKASCGRTVGNRLYRFSRPNPPKWLPPIAFVQIVQVAEACEAPSLEEFL